jgi:phosphatidylinositol alpha-mannosyltransferase
VRTHVDDLARTLQARGHQVSVLAPMDADPQPDTPTWVVDGGRPIALPYNGAVARVNFGLKAARRVRQWIRDERFDVLHIHEPVAPGLSLLACWAANGPMVATWHSAHERSRILSAGYALAQTAMEKVRGRIAVSEEARRTLVAHLGGDAVLIPNGVRLEPYRSAEPHPAFDPQRPSLLFLGRIDEPRKGLEVLLAALPAVLHAVPNLQVFIAGPGSVEDRRADIEPSLADHLTFLGRVSDEDKARALRSTSVYVAPHTGGESFGIVLIEAMAADAPVLASDLPAFRRVLGSPPAGVTFANQDSAALAVAAIQLLVNDAARATLRQMGQERVQVFDWDTVVDEVLAVYDSVRVPGQVVEEDLRGQLVGRLAAWGS